MASLGPESETVESTTVEKGAATARSTVMLRFDDQEDFALCSLAPGKTLQQPLDICFQEGEVIALHVAGNQTIHLSGYYTRSAMSEDNDFIDDDEEDALYSDEAEEDSQAEEDSEDEGDSEDDDDSEEEAASRKPRIEVLESDEESCCSEEHDHDHDDSEDDEDSAEFDSEEFDSEAETDEESELESEEEDVKPSKRSVHFDLPNGNKKSKPEAAEPAKVEAPKAEVKKPAAAQASPPKPVTAQQTKPAAPQDQAGKQAVNKTLPSGLKIEDLKLGNGAKAAQGKLVFIHYKGTLQNGKVFDSNMGGHPFKFRIGKGEVIKGMEIGVVGMAVGGTRRLTIPATLGYGNKPAGSIPKNSTLIFDITLAKTD